MRAGKEDERAAFLRARSRKGDFGPQESGKRKDRIKVLGLREANSRKSGKFAENGNFGDVRAASFIRSFGKREVCGRNAGMGRFGGRIGGIGGAFRSSG